MKTSNYLPYKYSIFFIKPFLSSNKDIQFNSAASKKLYTLIIATEKKSALDYTYWEKKILHQIENESSVADFERNFINLVILSKNNIQKKRSFRLYYLRNIPRFSKEVANVVMSK